MSLSKAYLVFYNAFCCVAWAYTLYLALSNFSLVQDAQFAKFFSIVELPLFVSQTLALLELFHSLLGLVRSPFITAFLQVGSRIVLVWGVNFLIPESRHQIGFPLMMIVGCVVDKKSTKLLIHLPHAELVSG